MEEKNGKNGKGDVCECGCHHDTCPWGMHHRGPWFIILRIAILLAIFWIGCEIGEMHAYLSNGYMGGWGHRSMMMDGYYQDAGTYGGGRSAPMIRTQSVTAQPSSTSPSPVQ